MKELKRCETCGSSCNFSEPNEPCYGVVEVVEEIEGVDGDCYWIHACEGHKDDGRYIPEPEGDAV